MCLTCFPALTISPPPPLSLFSPPSPFLAVEDNVTEDQHSPGQTAIPSGNAPFRVFPPFQPVARIRMSVESLLGFDALMFSSFSFFLFLQF